MGALAVRPTVRPTSDHPPDCYHSPPPPPRTRKHTSKVTKKKGLYGNTKGTQQFRYNARLDREHDKLR